jgi:hypothetical protein
MDQTDELLLKTRNTLRYCAGVMEEASAAISANDTQQATTLTMHALAEAMAEMQRLIDEIQRLRGLDNA